VLPLSPPPDTTPPEAPSSADELADRALPLLFADGAAAARLAMAALLAPSAGTAAHGVAHAVLALFELREGEVARGVHQRDAARALLLEETPGGRRLQDLLEQVQSQWHRREGRLDEAEALLRGLHARAGQRPPPDAYLSASALGSVLAMQGDSLGALDIGFEALAMARRGSDEMLLVNALNNLGSYQFDLYNLEDAAPLLEESLAGALRLASHRQTVFAAGNLVHCLCLMGEAPRALALAREHLIGRIAADDPPALHRDEEIAWVLIDNGLIDEAEAALSGEALVDTLSNELATARVWLGARILFARGHAAAALQHCLQRQALLDSEGDSGTPAIDHVHLLRLAAQAANQTGDPALAYRLLKQAFEKHEQLLGRAARSRQFSLQTAHRLRQAEWERDAAQQSATSLKALNESLRLQMEETERLRARLQAQALEDPLTGLHNRRHLMDAGERLLALMRRRGEPLAAVLMDIDHFKLVNDRHGHEAGDEVLRRFADAARAEVRAEDIVCRYGGEEFVLLMPGADAAQAQVRVERLLQRFTELRFAGHRGDAFSCSFSAGLAASLNGTESLQALLARVDAALYIAKDAGRSRVHIAR